MTTIPIKADVASKAYGAALFELADCLKVHEVEGGEYPTVDEVKRSPERYDGVVGGEGCATNAVIATYLAMLQAERREDPERCNNDDPIDWLVQAFDEWAAWWAKWDQARAAEKAPAE
jgi:hypothetical protein